MILREPPQNLDAEAACLAGLVLDPAWIDEVRLEGLRAEHFYRPSHRTLAEVVFALADAGTPIGGIAVMDEMRRRGEAERFGGDIALSDLMGVVAHAASTGYYAGLVRETALARSAIAACGEVIEAAYSGKLTAPEIVGLAESRVFALGGHDDGRHDGPIGDGADEVMDRISRRDCGETTGLPTGLPELDAMTDGLPDSALVVLGARPAMGKAQPDTSPVLTPWGFRPIGGLSVGDEVIGSDGRPTRVLGVFPQGEMPAFRVRFSDGTATECTADHLWFTQTRNERRRGCGGSVKTLRQIEATIGRETGGDRLAPNHRIPVVGPVEFAPEAAPSLPLHPYALGALLGDGGLGSNTILHNPEPDIQSRVASLLPPGDEMTVAADGITCRIRRAVRNNDRTETAKALARLGLDGADSYRKFIPYEYLHAAPADRRELLKGLMDTDGTVNISGRTVEFSTSSPALSADVAYLARSLGAIVSVVTRIPRYTYKGESLRGAESFRMVIDFPDGWAPVASAKHLAKWKGGAGRYHRSIVAVEPIGLRPCRCIKVAAPDSLYVTDDFILTHNTALALNLCEYVAFTSGQPALFVSLEMTRVELTERLMLARSGVFGHKLRQTALLTDRDRIALDRAHREVKACEHLFVDSAPGRTASQVAALARRYKAKHGIALLVVDYLQLVEADRDVRAARANRQEQVASVSRRFKALARELKIPVLALSQLNRGVEGRQDKRGESKRQGRPTMADLRESGQVEQDADLVLLLHRPEYYDPEDQPGVAELIVAKNRNGGTNVIRLRFEGALTKFSPLIAPAAVEDF